MADKGSPATPSDENDSITLDLELQGADEIETFFSNIVLAWRVGLEIQLDFARADLEKVVGFIKSTQEGKESPVGPLQAEACTRVIMSAQGFLQAWPKLVEIHKDLEKELGKKRG